MPDPLSITTGVVALLRVTVTVANELKQLHDGASVVNRTIAELANNVESLTRVLESMRTTFEAVTAEYGTGHISNLWESVAKSIEDGKDVLEQLQCLVQEINKETKFLDDHRKQLRLNRSGPKIMEFRMQIQSYRDSLHLSMQAILLWNQMTYQKSTDQLLPNLAEIHDDVRRVARMLNERIEVMQTTAGSGSQEQQTQVIAMNNLRDCVKAAASTISSATTVITSRHGGDPDHTIPASDFGDCFPQHHNLAMRRWMESRSVYEYDEVAVQGLPPQSVADVPAIDDTDSASDSDADLESEMTRGLFESAKRKLYSSDDMKDAEKMLRNCLGRLALTKATRSSEQISMRLEVVEHLCTIYTDQGRWNAAQDMLSQKMAMQERLTGGKQDLRFFTDVLSLARLTTKQKDFTTAHLHARRALRGFKKLREPMAIRVCLDLLIEVCEAGGNENDAEAYAIMLENLENSEESLTASTTSLSNGHLLRKGGSKTPVEVIPIPNIAIRAEPSAAEPFESSERFPIREETRTEHTGHGTSRMEKYQALDESIDPTLMPEKSELAAVDRGSTPQNAVSEIGKPAEQNLEDILREGVVDAFPRPDPGIASSSSEVENLDNTVKNGSGPVQPVVDAALLRDRVTTSPSIGIENMDHTVKDGIEAVQPLGFQTDPLPESLANDSEFVGREPAEYYPADSNHSEIAENDVIVAQSPVPSFSIVPTTPNSVDNDSSFSTAMNRPRSAPVDATSSDPDHSISGRTLPSQRHATNIEVPSVRHLPDDDGQLVNYGSAVITERRSFAIRMDTPHLPVDSHSRAVSNWSKAVREPPGLEVVAADVTPPASTTSRASTKSSVTLVSSPQTDSQTSEKQPKAAPRRSFVPMLVVKRSLIVVGDGACGKTALLFRFVKGVMISKNVPTVYDHWDADIEVDGRRIEFDLRDTAGFDSYPTVRHQAYHDSHVVLLCFSIAFPDSLDNVLEEWIPEVLLCNDRVPIILVGLQKDRRLDPATIENLAETHQHPVTYEEGEQMRKRIGASLYLECSAQTAEGVQTVFEEAARAAVQGKEQRQKAKRRSLFHWSRTRTTE